jgi:putative intracellular protease/amidase
MPKRVLIAVTNVDRFGEHDKATGLWFGELTHFIDALEEHGHAWEVCSPKGGDIPLDPRSLGVMFMKSTDRKRRGDETFMARLKNTTKANDVDPSQFDAVYYAGGHGTMWDFRDDEGLQRLAANVHANGGYLAAVCHGVTGLLEVSNAHGKKLVDGVDLTGYTDFEETLAGVKKLVPYSLQGELVKRGARFSKSLLPFRSYVKVDQRIVTGQNPQSAKAVGRALAKLLD